MSAITSNDGGRSRKRSRRGSSSGKAPSNNNNKDGTNSYYKNISFHERTSTGRPGSPHRYFEHSYDVSFHTCVDDRAPSSTSRSPALHTDATKDAALTTAAVEKADNNSNKQSNTTSNKNNATGNQVVHRHVNGLCIITAGNILQTALQQTTISSSDNGTSQHQSIVSIEYLVKIAPDAQSARGKLRAKNKKRKKYNNNNNNNDNDNDKDSTQGQDDSNCGDVSPTDTLCVVTLTNGQKVGLKCCVQGTIIELNHRLFVAADRVVEQQPQQQQSNNDACVNNDKGNPCNSRSCSIGAADGNASLLLTDPLLDGYLAVIMPNRGTQLPILLN
jgi:hypothetical protein